MKASVAEDARSNQSDGRALHVAHEIERVLRQMQADLEAAEAKFARTGEPAGFRQMQRPRRKEESLSHTECTMPTAREMADRVIKGRQVAWDRSDPTVAVVATQKLNPDDERAVRRTVQEAGYDGEAGEQMVRQVSALVVGQVEALADHLPATSSD